MGRGEKTRIVKNMPIFTKNSTSFEFLVTNLFNNPINKPTENIMVKYLEIKVTHTKYLSKISSHVIHYVNVP